MTAGASPVTYFAGQTFGFWTVESGSVDQVGSLWTASDGQQSLDLNGFENGVLYQDLQTVPGQTYLLRFAMAGNPDGGPTFRQMAVWWDTSSLDTLTFDTTGHTDTTGTVAVDRLKRRFGVDVELRRPQLPPRLTPRPSPLRLR